MSDDWIAIESPPPGATPAEMLPLARGLMGLDDEERKRLGGDLRREWPSEMGQLQAATAEMKPLRDKILRYSPLPHKFSGDFPDERALALSLALQVAAGGPRIKRCPHISPDRPHLWFASLSGGYLVCVRCLPAPRGGEGPWPDECDLCRTTTHRFTEVGQIIGPLYVHANLCADCIAYSPVGAS